MSETAKTLNDLADRAEMEAEMCADRPQAMVILKSGRARHVAEVIAAYERVTDFFLACLMMRGNKNPKRNVRFREHWKIPIEMSLDDFSQALINDAKREGAKS